MLKKGTLILLILGLSLGVFNNALAWSKATHEGLSQETVNFYNLIFPNNPLTEEQKEWIALGSRLEDETPRWINHFYDPINKTGWTGAHAGTFSAEDIKKWVARTLIISTDPRSAVEWANDSWTQKTAYERYGGDRTWSAGLRHYAEGNLKEAYVTLGHVLHLLQDMAVPDHTRDDTHAETLAFLTGDPGSPLEIYIRETYGKEGIKSFNLPKVLIEENRSLPRKLFLEEYFVDVAKYSNKYFFSKDTIYDERYKYPKIIRVEDGYGYGLDKNGEEFLLTSVRATRDDLGNIYLKHYLGADSEREEDVLDAYFERLAPKAVLYGAGLIDFFHREGEKEKENLQYPSRIIKYDFSFLPSFPSSPLAELEKIKNRVTDTASSLKNKTTSFFNTLTEPFGEALDAFGGFVSGIFPDTKTPSPDLSPHQDEETAQQSLPESTEEKIAQDESVLQETETSEEDIFSGETIDKESFVSSYPSEEEESVDKLGVAVSIEEILKRLEKILTAMKELEEEDEGFVAGVIDIIEEYSAGLTYSRSSGSRGGTVSSSVADDSTKEDDSAGKSEEPCVDLNTAEKDELTKLIHIGDARAEDLISLRPFSSIDELIHISGISEARLADIKEQGLVCEEYLIDAPDDPKEKDEQKEGEKEETEKDKEEKKEESPPASVAGFGASNVLVSEILFNAEGSDVGKEFVELYNPKNSPIDLDGWALRYAREDKPGETFSLARLGFSDDDKTEIPPLGFFLIGLNNYDASNYRGVEPDVLRSASLLDGGTKSNPLNITIILLDGEGKEIDKATYNANSINVPGESLERRGWKNGECFYPQNEGEFLGNACKVSNSGAFVTRANPTPQNSNSLPEPRTAPRLTDLTAEYDKKSFNIVFNWEESEDVTGATSTIVYRITKKSDSDEVIFNRARADGFSYRLDEVGRDYLFSVSAIDRDGMPSEEVTKEFNIPSFIDNIYFYRDVREETEDMYLLEAYYSDFPFTPNIYREGEFWQGLVFYINREANKDNRFLTTFNHHNPEDMNGVLRLRWPTCSSATLGLPRGYAIYSLTSEYCRIAGQLWSSSLRRNQYNDSRLSVFVSQTADNITFTEDDYITVAFYDFYRSGGGSQTLGLVAVDVNKYYFQNAPSPQEPLLMQGKLDVNFDGLASTLEIDWEAAKNSPTLNRISHYEINFSPGEDDGFDGDLWENVGTFRGFSKKVGEDDDFLIGVRVFDDFGNASNPLTARWSFPDDFKLSDWGGIIDETFVMQCGVRENCTTEGSPRSNIVEHDLGEEMEIYKIRVDASHVSGNQSSCNRRHIRAVVLDAETEEIIAVTENSRRALCNANTLIDEDLLFATPVTIGPNIKIHFENAGYMAARVRYEIKNVKLYRVLE